MRTCQHRNLATARLCRVEQCDHGTIHLVLGDLTLRVQRDEFLELTGALELAAARLQGFSPERRPC